MVEFHVRVSALISLHPQSPLFRTIHPPTHKHPPSREKGAYHKTNPPAPSSKLIILYILTFRIPAIRILGQEVMQPLGLTGLSLLTLAESGPELAQALRTLASRNPTLVHCTHGKDRTGLVVALALLVLRVPAAAVAHDYLLSQPGLERERAERVAEMRSIGLTPEWGGCSPDLIARVCGHLDVRYGGVEAYLDSVGFEAEERARLIDVLGA
jgi:protein-tyrosine phosphatase